MLEALGLLGDDLRCTLKATRRAIHVSAPTRTFDGGAASTAAVSDTEIETSLWPLTRWILRLYDDANGDTAATTTTTATTTCDSPPDTTRRRIVVGVVGGAGAGKSTLCALLSSSLDAALEARAEGEASAVVSMDGYHLTNAVLKSRNLAGEKGRPDTIDSSGLAADLCAIRDAATQPRACVAVPIYDRKVTHDPVPGALVIGPQHAIVLVEGLHLLRGAAGVSEGGSGDGGSEEGSGGGSEEGSEGGSGRGIGGIGIGRNLKGDSGDECEQGVPEPQGSELEEGAQIQTTGRTEKQDRWADVRGSLDACVLLDIPYDISKRRVVDRKVKGGRDREDAAAHFEKADRVTLDEVGCLVECIVGGGGGGGRWSGPPVLLIQLGGEDDGEEGDDCGGGGEEGKEMGGAGVKEAAMCAAVGGPSSAVVSGLPVRSLQYLHANTHTAIMVPRV